MKRKNENRKLGVEGKKKYEFYVEESGKEAAETRIM